jgi:enoyl-CoA hydratase
MLLTLNSSVQWARNVKLRATMKTYGRWLSPALGNFSQAASISRKPPAAATGSATWLVRKTMACLCLWTLPKPTVAMVNGHAIAGGVIIALACDFRITQAGSHRFGLNEVAIGLAFPRGAFEIARLALSNQQLRWTMLEAGLFDVGRAMEMGIVDEIVETARLEARCIEVAKRLGANGRQAYAHTKHKIQAEAIAGVLNQDIEEAREVARITQSEETRALIAAQVNTLTRR